MPYRYVRQMVADWRGMARKFNDTAESFFKKNKDRFVMHPVTLIRVRMVID